MIAVADMSVETTNEVDCLSDVALPIFEFEDINAGTSASHKRCETRALADIVAIEGTFMKTRTHSVKRFRGLVSCGVVVFFVVFLGFDNLASEYPVGSQYVVEYIGVQRVVVVKHAECATGFEDNTSHLSQIRDAGPSYAAGDFVVRY